jgi:hypothetical protein
MCSFCYMGDALPEHSPAAFRLPRASFGPQCAIHDDFGQKELLATRDLTRFSGTSHFDEIACYLSLQCSARIVAGETTRVFDGEDPLRGANLRRRARMKHEPAHAAASPAS